MQLGGTVSRTFGPSRWPRAVQPRVPSTAASDTVRPCRLDGDMETRRLHVPQKTRGRTREAFKHSMYLRKTLSVNPDTWQVETVKVDETLLALCLTDAFYLTFTRGKHLFMLERASVTTALPQHKLTPASHRSAAGFQWNGACGGCGSMVVSSSMASSLAW